MVEEVDVRERLSDSAVYLWGDYFTVSLKSSGLLWASDSYTIP